MAKPKIKYTSYGVGYLVTDNGKRWIELNKNLLKYPQLHDKILAHELEHFNSPNKHIDFMIDFKSLFDLKLGCELAKFSINHPKALLSNSPILYDNRKWSVNWFMMIFNLFILSLIIGGILILV